jgi:DNA-binding MarR family transcriptional regulator
MNVIFFGLKRAYHGTLRVTRQALARLGLTAARFDLLYIVQKGGEMTQRELRKALGVSGPTVSRMLGSLEELGLIEREVSDLDRRERYVMLTKAGRRCVRKAARLLIHPGHVQLALDGALGGDQWHNAIACEKAKNACDHMLGRLRRAFGDVATFAYPFSNDDREAEICQLERIRALIDRESSFAVA